MSQQGGGLGAGTPGPNALVTKRKGGKCAQCKGPCSMTKIEHASCSVCQKNYHYSCLGSEPGLMKMLIKTAGLEFVCKSCQSPSGRRPPAATALAGMEDAEAQIEDLKV